MNTTLPQSGEVFDFRYRIVCRLGCGADGYVFGATELDTGKRVAIKCWIGPHAEDALLAAQHFVRSAHEARLFDNPNIVEVFAAEAGRTVNYCVMDWLEGMTLSRRIARKRPSPLADVFNIVLPCMRAVAEAHAAGIVHGDLRPAHIYVCHATKHRLGIARVFDFGRGPAGLPSVDNVSRAPNAEAYQYATPEQLLGTALDARSDTYAFGIMLFEMLAGERPFIADSSEELARKIKAGSFKLLASISPSIPVRLAHIVERAMAVDPAQRYANLGQMADALQEFDPTPSLSYVAVAPEVSAPRTSASSSTALALRGSAGPRRSTPPPPPPPRVHKQASQTNQPRQTGQVAPPAREIEDITTTSASWELTEPLALGRYQYELLRRVSWQRAAVWCLVLGSAVIAGRYLQQMAAPTAHLPGGAQDRDVLSPASGFDAATCDNPIGATDPACAHVVVPVPMPEVIVPTPMPVPRVTTTTSHAAGATTTAAPAARPQRAPSPARATTPKRATSRAHESGAPTRSSPSNAAPKSNQKHTEPAPKRSRNNENSNSNDPFERLDRMRLQ